MTDIETESFLSCLNRHNRYYYQTVPKNYIAWLNDHDADISNIGGKGASLARLATSGFPVPPGFTLTAKAYIEFSEMLELPESLHQVNDLKQGAKMPEIVAALEPVEKKLQTAHLPDAIDSSLNEAYAKLVSVIGKEASFAVRSSALSEDGGGNSFAGLYESYVNIKGIEAITKAVLDCYRCLWSPRATHYRSFRNVEHASETMATVIMQTVDAKISGVVFSKNPLTGSSEEIVINSSWGFGESIVSGYVTPDMYIVDHRGNLISKEINHKTEQSSLSDEGISRSQTPSDLADLPSLSEKQISELVRITNEVEQLYGQSIDLEFSYDKNETLFLLQARPITA